MKTTRRRLLGLIGLGAAAAALAPVAAAETANSIQPPSRHRTPGDTDLARCCVTCGWTTPWSNAETTMEGLFVEAGQIAAHNVEAHDGVTQEVYGVWRPHDWQSAIAQARADGYNRGREVEAAAWEARQAKTTD